MVHTVEIEVAGRTLRLETGRVARQADGSIWASYGDTVVLATAVASQVAKAGIDFLPLTVDYQEKSFAAGKIPGGYFKREARPSEKAVLTSRQIDRGFVRSSLRAITSRPRSSPQSSRPIRRARPTSLPLSPPLLP